MAKDKPWPRVCTCRGGAKKGNPAIYTVYPFVVTNFQVVYGFAGKSRSLVVPKVRCGKCERCGEIWYDNRADEDIEISSRTIVIRC